MGLLKTETIYNGMEVTYHHIAHITTDMYTGSCQAVLHSWPSKEARTPVTPPLLTRNYNFNLTGESAMIDGYNAIKALPYWADAIDA